LLSWNMRPKLAPDPGSAVALLEEASRSSQPFRLVIVDAMMPDLDGFETAARIRKDPRFSGTGIIMLTSASSAALAQRSQDSGVDLYLKKPILQSDLLSALLRVIGAQEAPDVSACNGKSQFGRSGKSLRILIAEDNPVNQQIAVRLLEKRGHSPVVCASGEECLALLEKEEIDVVLMDLQMPDMGGIEITRCIRERERDGRRRVPIVAMTAHTMKGDRERCLAAGMDGYLPKPVEPQDLCQRGEACGSAPATSASPPVGDNSENSPSESGVIDAPPVIARFGGDGAFLLSNLEIFRTRYRDLLAEARQSLSDRDFVRLERAAHSLKGSVGNFGGKSAVEAVLRLERSSREQNAEHASSACSLLEWEIERLVKAAAELGRGLTVGSAIH